ncbi:MAG: hypothetical protein SGCHY_001005 [Lobulomycetales sp.]
MPVFMSPPAMTTELLPSIVVPSSPASSFEPLRRASHFTPMMGSPLAGVMTSAELMSSPAASEECLSLDVLKSSYPSPSGNYEAEIDAFFASPSMLPLASGLRSPESPVSPPESSRRKSSLLQDALRKYSTASEDSLLQDAIRKNSTASEDSDGSSSEPKFSCPHPGCGRQFTRLYNVKSHMVCHSGDRPHQCSQCTASFRRKHDLQRHYRTSHSQDRPWKCNRCSRSFARRDHYRRHMAVEDALAEKRLASAHEMSLNLAELAATNPIAMTLF